MRHYHSATTSGIDIPNHALLNKNDAYLVYSERTIFDRISHEHKAMENIHSTIV